MAREGKYYDVSRKVVLSLFSLTITLEFDLYPLHVSGPIHPSLKVFNVFPSSSSSCGGKNMASQGWLVAVRGLQSARCILRATITGSTKCTATKGIGTKECRRTFMSSIIRRGKKISSSK